MRVGVWALRSGQDVKFEQPSACLPLGLGYMQANPINLKISCFIEFARAVMSP